MKLATGCGTTARSTTARGASLLAAMSLMFAACGSSSSDNGLASSAEAPTTAVQPPETTASVEETTTTTVEETTTTVEETTTTTEVAADDGGSDPFEGMTAEERADVLAQMDLTEEELAQFEALLETDVGREIMAQGIVESTGITIEQALCIVEEGDIIGLMIGVTGGTTEPDSEVTASFLRTLDTCGIPLSAFEG